MFFSWESTCCNITLNIYSKTKNNKNLIFMPYFVGLFGIYWLNDHLPRNSSSFSSIVRYSLRVQIFFQFQTNSSKISFIGARLSSLFRSRRFDASSKCKQLCKEKNCFKHIEVRKMFTPVLSVRYKSLKLDD